MNNLINPITIALTVATAFGIFTHDTQLDRATAIAIATPATIAAYAAADASIKSSDHTHVEKVTIHRHLGSIRMNVPRIQPRDDDRRYVLTKKIMLGSDTTSLWPSV